MKNIATRLLKIFIVFSLIYLFEETMIFWFGDRCADMAGGYFDRYPPACGKPVEISKILRFSMMGFYSILIVLILGKFKNK